MILDQAWTWGLTTIQSLDLEVDNSTRQGLNLELDKDTRPSVDLELDKLTTCCDDLLPVNIDQLNSSHQSNSHDCKQRGGAGWVGVEQEMGRSIWSLGN